MRTTPSRLALLLVVLLPALSACRTVDDTGPGPMRWTPAKTSPVLVADAVLRASYYPYMSPMTYQWFVFVRGRKVRTLDELRTYVVPIDTQERAFAYRELLRDVHLPGEGDGFARAQGTSLTYRPERRDWLAEYGADDAKRWGVATEPQITRRGKAFVIVEPQHRYIEDTSPLEPDVVRVGTEAVELVQETLYEDGRYERAVLRMLEEGKAAEPYGPMPLL